jgi:hypothetical protein
MSPGPGDAADDRAARDARWQQNYNAPVGTVINIETLQDAAALGQFITGPVSDKELLAPTLIDRGFQIRALAERIEEVEAADEAASLLVVIPGCFADMHHALVQRCARIELAKAAANDAPWRDLRQLEWPEGASSIDPVLKEIRDRLSLSKRLRREEIESAVAGLDANLCFSHLITGPLWEQDDGALLRKWVEYFATGALRPSPGHLLVNFLCLELADPRTAACRKLEAYIGELMGTSGENGATILVTRILNPIEQQHVVQWVSKASTFLGSDWVEADLIGLPYQLFGDDPAPRPFAAVFEPIREALARSMRGNRQPQFMEASK